MLSGLKHINFDKIDQAVPVALMLIAMPISGSIGHAIGIGLIVFSFINIFTGKAEKRYILLHSTAARHEGDLKNYINREIDLTSAEYIYGISLGYAYDSFLGPIEASLGYSSLAPGLNFYLNVGHNF